MMVLGPDLGMQVAEANNLAVYMILKQEQGFKTTYTKAFGEYLQGKD